MLRIATNAEYLWDPDTAAGSYSITWLGLVYDRLVHTTPDGSLAPGLATDWRYSNGGRVLTFTLRDGVTFQDGEPFDADAVKVNIERSQTHPESAVVSDLSRIERVVAVDPTTVRLELSSPDATLPAVMSGQAGAMISPAAIDGDLEQRPVGAGMFKLASLQPGAGFRVERWDGYWDPKAVQLAAIEVSIMPGSVPRVNALKTGQVDIAPVEPEDVDEVESSSSEVDVRLNDTLRYVYLALNQGEEPLDDVRVRQAISHAIDREAMVEGPFHGYGEPTVQPWPASYFPHVSELDDLYPYDPERAHELLEEAGVGDGFSMDVIAVPDPRVYGEIGEVVQAQLAEVGIDVKIRVTPASALGQDFYVDKVAEGAVLYTNGSVDPALTVGGRYSAEGFYNTGGTSTERLETLYRQAIATTDDARRTEIMQAVSDEVVNEVLDMPLFFAQEPEGVSQRVVGYESWLTGKPEFRGVAVTR